MESQSEGIEGYSLQRKGVVTITEEWYIEKIYEGKQNYPASAALSRVSVFVGGVLIHQETCNLHLKGKTSRSIYDEITDIAFRPKSYIRRNSNPKEIGNVVNYRSYFISLFGTRWRKIFNLK